MQKKLSVAITRPAHQAEPLAKLITAAGGKTLIFPTIEILPIADNQNLSQAVANLSQYSLIIFLSANAVAAALPLMTQPYPANIVAIGPGTAKALQTYGITTVQLPNTYNSEGILELPLLQNISGKKIAIFCGENPRPLLKAALDQRSAEVDEVICYRRGCPSIDPLPARKQWQDADINLIISTSSESLANLCQLFINTSTADWLLPIPLLVISPQVAAQARRAGFQSIITVQNPSDSAIFAAICDRFKLNPPFKKGDEEPNRYKREN